MIANNVLKEKADQVETTKKAGVKSGNLSIKDMIVAYKDEIAKALPAVITPERFTRIVTSAVSANPKLQLCTDMSFLAAMLNAAQLGLEPNTPLGQAYLIPYENRKKGIIECQFQIGYRGLMELAYRTGEYKTIYAHTVYENDEFRYTFGLDADLYHKPTLQADRGKPVAYYAVYKLTNGGYNFDVMSAPVVAQFGKEKSKSYQFGPWQTDFDGMAKKTVLKQLLKYAPMKSDLAKAFSTDESIKTELSEDMSTVPSEIDFIDITPDDVQDSDTEIGKN